MDEEGVECRNQFVSKRKKEGWTHERFVAGVKKKKKIPCAQLHEFRIVLMTSNESRL